MHKIIELIDKKHEEASASQNPRWYLGPSILGHECTRFLWLGFRWAEKNNLDGRILRLFRRGHKEEETVVDDLRSIGIVVESTGTEQATVPLPPHMSGHADGIVKGVPDDEETPHLLEIKTHNLKSFNKLKKDGIRKHKPEHYLQMQVYMHGLELEKGLYYSVCKDNDEVYIEIILYDEVFARKAIKRGIDITLTHGLPDPISQDGTWWKCRRCSAHSFCHGDGQIVQTHCRVCKSIAPMENGTWYCELHEKTINEDQQLKGCKHFTLHQDLEKSSQQEFD